MEEPHDNDAERALLGAVLTDNAALSRARSLPTNDFHAPAHRRIWGAMLELAGEGKPIDHLTLSERLQARGALGKIGGPAYLMQLDQAVPITSNAGQYAAIVRDRAARRAMVAIGRRLAELAHDAGKDPLETRQGAQHALAALSSGSYRLRSMTEVADGIRQHLQAIEEDKAEPIIPTGLRALDRVIGGLQPTLTIVGARTGVGKSAWAATVIQNVAQYFTNRDLGEKVGVISLEDEGEWLPYRLLAHASGVAGFVLRFRKKTEMQWKAIGEGDARLRQYSDNVIIDDRPDLSSSEISQVADDMVLNHGARMLLIDHMQEVNHWAHKLETLEQNMTRSLVDIRGISKRHGIPVVLLCQMREDDKVKAGQFQGAGGFYGARETVKKSRVAIELAREHDSDKMAMRVLKHTNGVGHRDVEVQFIGAAAMVRDLEGEQGSLEFDGTPRPEEFTKEPEEAA